MDAKTVTTPPGSPLFGARRHGTPKPLSSNTNKTLTIQNLDGSPLWSPAKLLDDSSRYRAASAPDTSAIIRQPTKGILSMHNGMTTTVPQNMNKDSSHRPSRTPVARLRQFSVQSREHLELKCCRINVLLVVMQSCMGVVVTALAFYMQTLTSTLVLRECPYWAGIPVSQTFKLMYCVAILPGYVH